jgi:uncharacterized membrane protein
MTALILGLVIFLGVHSLRIVAEPWRAACARASAKGRTRGCTRWRRIVGFGLLIWGFGVARQQPVMLWRRCCGRATSRRC